MQSILGIDYGDKRVGLALGQLGGLALPYKVISYAAWPELLVQLENIIEQENIGQIVVGLPHSLSGAVNERLRKTEEFVHWLQRQLAVSVHTVDERMTSELYSRQGLKHDIDKYAAAAILETYLTQHAR